jgi:hypothetical protein
LHGEFKVVKVIWLRQAHISLVSRLFLFPESEAEEIRWVLRLENIPVLIYSAFICMHEISVVCWWVGCSRIWLIDGPPCFVGVCQVA